MAPWEIGRSNSSDNVNCLVRIAFSFSQKKIQLQIRFSPASALGAASRPWNKNNHSSDVNQSVLLIGRLELMLCIC